MQNKYVYILILVFLIACSKKEKELSENNLQEYLEIYSHNQLDEVIACAGSEKGNSNSVLIYYYPITGSSNYRYYETDNINIDSNDFSNYRLKQFPSEGVFGNKLSFFIRELKNEAWGIVTFLLEGKVHKSNPIRLKQNTTSTIYNSDIVINATLLEPEFCWNKSIYGNEVIYFQALVSEKNDFVSGTYTNERCFRYYNTDNVVLDINTGIPESLVKNENYKMTILGVTEDNWVNLHSEMIFMIDK